VGLAIYCKYSLEPGFRYLCIHSPALQPFSQKPRTPTVAPLCQIGLCDPVKADL